MSLMRLRVLTMILVLLTPMIFACAPNAGKDGADGSGADGADGLPGADGSGNGSAPQSPSGLTAEAQSPSQIDVHWVFNTGTELGFNIQRSETEGEWETIAGTAANVTVYHDDSVECENTYSYRVLAYNDYGESAPSSAVDATADWCPIAAPSGLYAQVLGPDAVRLSWDDNEDNHEGFRIYRDDEELTTVGAATPFYDDSGLDCETLYRYRVTAYNANVESNFSNASVAETDYCPVATPENLTATGMDIDEIILTWEDSSSNETNFEIQRRTAGSGEAWDALAMEAANTEQYSDMDVECRIDYEYRVMAYNANVESAWSDTNTGQTIGCTPIRPRPVLETLSPLSHLALSRDFLDDPPDPLYPLTLNGAGIAADTHVLVGNLAIPCVSDALDCQADENGDPDEENGYCASSCTAALPDLVMKNVGTYMVRLSTPDPVWSGLNISENTLTFSVVAPIPDITKTWPRGVMQLLDESGGPIPQEITVSVWGRNMVDNVQFKLASNFGEIQEPGIQTDPETGDQYAEVKISTKNIIPRNSEYFFSAVNPSPGGGERSRPFGVNQRVEEWSDQVLTTLKSTWAGGPNRLVWNRFSAPKELSSTGVGWSGGKGWAVVRDIDGKLLTRVKSENAAGAIPLPFVGETWIELQANINIGFLETIFNHAPLLRGDGTFGALTTLSGGNAPVSIFLSDVNGDGAADMITADVTSDTVSIRLGDGDGTFGARTSRPMGDEPSSIFVSDINGDGAADLVTADFDSDTASIRLGSGDGTFGDRTSLSMGDGPSSIFVSDLNGDGTPDLATADLNSDTVSIRLGAGDGAFVTFTSLPMGDGPVSIFVSDLNGDGAPDLATADSESDTVSIRLGAGDGTFGVLTSLQMGDGPNSIFISDLNGDGATDLVTADGDSDTVSIRLGAGDGTFGERLSRSMGNRPSSVFISDVNGDGAPDLITADIYDNQVSIRPGNGDGTFGARTSRSMGAAPSSVFVSDVSGDGAPDLVTADTFSDTVSIRLSASDRSFGALIALPTGGQPCSVFVSDVNGDGAPDLITADSESDAVSIRLGTGDGTFGDRTSLSMGVEPNSIIAKDVNGDDAPDLVTANTDDSVSIRLGVGDGTFGARTSLSMGNRPASIFVLDLNGDDVPDLGTADKYDDAVSVRLGTGDGSFGTRDSLPMGRFVNSIFASDINSDGAPDLATADKWDNTVSIRMGNGDGTFRECSSWPMGDYPNSVFISDLNGDGAPDMVTADVISDTVSIRLGVGDGTFGARTALSMGDSPSSVYVSDVNIDGKPDLITSGNDTVLIRLGNGDGTFGSITSFPTGSCPFFVLAADLNGDSMPELITADYNDDTVSIRFLDIPGSWHQELTDSFSDNPDQPWLPKYTENGFTELDIHQYRQTISKVGVRVFLEWTTQPAGSVDLGLTAPDGQMVDLGSFSAFTPWPDAVTPTSWRLNKTFRGYDFNGETGIAGLIDLHGLQPTDYWTLSIDNQTGTSAEVKNFTVLTDGHF